MSTAATPSPSLMTNLRAELMRHPPFSQMQPAHVDRFVAEARQAYYAPGEVVLEPAMGPVDMLHLIRQGHITGRRGIAEMSGGLQYEPGDLFPVGSVLGKRPVTSTYTASDDCFCLLLAADAVTRLAADSAPFADYLNRPRCTSRSCRTVRYRPRMRRRRWPSSRSRRGWPRCRARIHWLAHPTRRCSRRSRRCTNAAWARYW